MLPHSIASAIRQEDASAARPVYTSSFLWRRQKGQCSYPTGTLLIECNQYILVILECWAFLLFAGPEVNFPGDLCVIKQYYLFLEPQQGNKLASSVLFLSASRSFISLFTLIRLRVQ